MLMGGPDFHHDGSDLYVSRRNPTLGEVVTVFVRGAVASGVTRVFARVISDAEPKLIPAAIDRRTPHEIWWRATVRAYNPVTRYRFLLDGVAGYHWLTAAGVSDQDCPDDTDFRLLADAAPPAWARDAIVYQIFPDRFARSPRADSRATPDWAIQCRWDTPVIGRGPQTARQFYGGDLDGITGRLDHVASLGANTIYLTPIFPARSNHRYDASSFTDVDPMLGGEKALDRLSAAVHDRGLRLVGDLTTNHTGDRHSWFTGPESEDLYYWANGDYAKWLGVPSLPKLDWGSRRLRELFLDGPDAVATRWLDQLDGWRVDVANMTGRYQGDDYNHEVARLLAAAVRAARPDAVLVGEHTSDGTGDLDRGGWQGTMNYAGFTRPMWNWLRAPEPAGPDSLRLPPAVHRRPGPAVVEVMRAFASRISWRSLVHSWTLLNSHDTPRFRTVTANPDLVEVGLGMQVGYPGAPMIFAGDELGLVGVNGEDARRPMPWHRPETWHQPTLDRYRALLRLRANQPALRDGGLRYAYAGPDAIAYWRETATSRLLVFARRAAGTPVAVRLPGVTHATNVYGGAVLPVAGGAAALPGDGPTVQVWECA